MSPLANNSTEVEKTLNTSYNGDINNKLIEPAAATASIALVVIILILIAVVIGLIRYVVQRRREQRGNEDSDTDNSDYNDPYIFMEKSSVSKRSQPVVSDGSYVEVAKQLTLQQDPQDYEVPKESSQESMEKSEQDQHYQNHEVWSDRHIPEYENLPEYENNDAIRKSLQDLIMRRCISEIEDEYENQEIIDSQFQSLECLDSSSYVFPDHLPSQGTQPYTNCGRPPSLVHSYVNTPHRKSGHSKSVDDHSYVTIIN